MIKMVKGDKVKYVSSRKMANDLKYFGWVEDDNGQGTN